MKLSFMTWVCPEWTLERIVHFAKCAGYDGVEIRVDVNHKHGISSKLSEEHRRLARKLFEQAGVGVSAVATSEKFGSPNPEERRVNIEAAKRNIDLAHDLGARVVRIFGGPPMISDEVFDYIAEAFTEVGNYGSGLGVKPLLETMHDAFDRAEYAAEVLKRVRTQNFGILWNLSTIDIVSFELLKKHIKHLHIHDEVLDPSNKNVFNTARMLKTVGFDGYFSLEVMKGQLPEELLVTTCRRLKSYLEQVR